MDEVDAFLDIVEADVSQYADDLQRLQVHDRPFAKRIEHRHEDHAPAGPRRIRDNRADHTDADLFHVGRSYFCNRLQFIWTAFSFIVKRRKEPCPVAAYSISGKIITACKSF